MILNLSLCLLGSFLHNLVLNQLELSLYQMNRLLII